MTKKPRKQQYKWPKKREGNKYCQLCLTTTGLIRAYGMQICRRCFREKAKDLGFEKY